MLNKHDKNRPNWFSWVWCCVFHSPNPPALFPMSKSTTVLGALPYTDVYAMLLPPSHRNSQTHLVRHRKTINIKQNQRLHIRPLQLICKQNFTARTIFTCSLGTHNFVVKSEMRQCAVWVVGLWSQLFPRLFLTHLRPMLEERQAPPQRLSLVSRVAFMLHENQKQISRTRSEPFHLSRIVQAWSEEAGVNLRLTPPSTDRYASNNVTFMALKRQHAAIHPTPLGAQSPWSSQ